MVTAGGEEGALKPWGPAPRFCSWPGSQGLPSSTPIPALCTHVSPPFALAPPGASRPPTQPHTHHTQCSSVWLDSSSPLSGHRSQWLQDTPKHPSLLRGSLWGGVLEVFPSPPEGTQKLHPNSPGLGNGRQGRVQLHMRAPCLMTPPQASSSPNAAPLLPSFKPPLFHYDHQPLNEILNRNYHFYTLLYSPEWSIISHKKE